jgi:hypothetical protein
VKIIEGEKKKKTQIEVRDFISFVKSYGRATKSEIHPTPLAPHFAVCAEVPPSYCRRQGFSARNVKKALGIYRIHPNYCV